MADRRCVGMKADSRLLRSSANGVFGFEVGAGDIPAPGAALLGLIGLAGVRVVRRRIA